MKEDGSLCILVALAMALSCCSREAGPGVDTAALRSSAEAGEAEAQFLLGRLYEEGEELEEDLGQAVKWYRAAAGQGHVDGQFYLAEKYSEGWGVEVDLEEAEKWFRLAAVQGDSSAQYNLGVMNYLEGEGLRVDLIEALRWFRAAAAQGDADALYSLGLMYESGEGVEADVEAAFSYFLQAAMQKHVAAMWSLGALYEAGEGVERNYEEAIDWYWGAAEADEPDVDAMNDLGWVYATCPEADLRDARRAVRYALMANIEEPNEYSYKDTLAAAYGRNGWFEDAVAAQRRAIELALEDGELEGEERDETLKDFEARLELYEQGQPYAESAQ